MINVSMNICNQYGSLHYVPMLWECEKSSEFIQFLRDDIINILNWAHEKNIPKSSLILAFVIDEPDTSDGSCWTWDFIVSVKNIREAQPYLKMDREEFEAELRNSKIENLFK